MSRDEPAVPRGDGPAAPVARLFSDRPALTARRRGVMMHELPATKGLLQVALDAAAAAGAQRVLAIDVVVGELTSMVDDSVQFYFDLLSRDTPAGGAMLRFRREPALAECGSCGTRTPVRPPLSPTCAACGALALRVSGGQDFYVESIEVADESARRDPGAEGE